VSETEIPTRDQILAKIVEILADFELDPKTITPASTLYEDLDLDSIDAIDIFTDLRELTGRRPDPADARKVRTVGELIDFVLAEIERKNAGVPKSAASSARPPSPADLAAAGKDEPSS
jgi:acyl carrier protein